MKTITAALFILGTALTAADFDESEARALFEATQQESLDPVQQLYREGVPHTDRQGRPLREYDPERSFFPIALWGPPMHGEAFGTFYDWGELKEAGFNTVWPFGFSNIYTTAQQCPHTPEALDRLGEAFDMQIVFMQPISPEELAAVKNHPRLLANVWADEPTGRLESADMEALFQSYLEYREQCAAIAPELPVLVNDVAWIDQPATRWFLRWNTAGEIACHDNYPVKVSSGNTDTLARAPGGIPQALLLAARGNRETKPSWLIVGAFEQPGSVENYFAFRFPTPQQLRASVYAGLVYGATGIVYFAMDSFWTRTSMVVGMSPDPREHVVSDPALRGPGKLEQLSMTPAQRAVSRSLWETAAQLNHELAVLTPALLSPTVRPETLAYRTETSVVKGDSDSGSPVRTLLKRDPESGRYVLLTVNVEAVAAILEVHFDRPLTACEILFNASQHRPELSGDGRSVRFELEPFDAYPILFDCP